MTTQLLTFTAEHVNAYKRLVSGWAYVVKYADGSNVYDHNYNATMDPEDMAMAAYKYLLSGGRIDIEHDQITVGRVCAMIPTTEAMQKAMGIETPIKQGIFMTIYVDDDDTWERVKNREFPMLSIGATGILIDLEEEDGE